MSPTTESSSERSALGPRMAAVAGLALMVGLAFNSLSPLGVRATATASTDAAVDSASHHPAGPKRLYENETVALSLETEGPPTGTAPSGNPAPSVAMLTWSETSKLLAAKQIVLVDARAAVYYQTEHVPGAVSLPANSPPQDLAAFTAQYPKSTPLVVYCGSVQCPLARELVAVLTGQLGYTNVREMPGGFAEYRQFQSQLAKGVAR